MFLGKFTGKTYFYWIHSTTSPNSASKPCRVSARKSSLHLLLSSVPKKLQAPDKFLCTQDSSYVLKIEKNILLDTFSSSLRDAGDTSECLLNSGLRGGAKPLPTLPTVRAPPDDPNLASECRRCSSCSGISSKLSFESCVITAARDCIFLEIQLLLTRDDTQCLFKRWV